MRRKILRILTGGSLAILVILLALRLVDGVCFAMGRPAAAGACNYEGYWTSESAPTVGGRILAELPSPLPVGQAFTVKAFIYYKMPSLYRMGSFVPMEMEGMVDPSGTTAGGNADSPVVLPPRITFKLKGGPGGSGGSQTIDYVSTADSEFLKIAGGYRSSSPYDLGTFSLTKKR